MDFCTSSAASSRGILYASPSSCLGSSRLGNVLGNTSQYLHNMVHNKALFFSSTFSKCGIAPCGRPFSLYNISYRNNMGLPYIFNYLSYMMWEPLMVPFRNLDHISITLVGSFFKIHVMCTESVSLIVYKIYSICGVFNK